MMLSLDLQSIEKFLIKQGLEPKLQKETNQLYIIFKWEKFEFPLFIKIGEEQKTLQLLVFLPTKVKENHFLETCRLLHLFNKEIDAPGFGIDETSSLTFYRVCLPSIDKKIHTSTVDSYLKAIPLICQAYAPAILALASGVMSYEQILKSKP